MRVVQIRKVPWLGYLTEMVIAVIVLSSSALQIGASGGEYLAVERQLGNLTLGDFSVVLLLGLLLLQAGSRNELLRLFFERRYGLLALAGTLALLLPVAFAEEKTYQLKQASQFLFVVWLLVPVLAVGAAMADSFQAIVRRQAYFFAVVYSLGVVLYFGFGNTSILRLYGENRLFSNMLFDNCGFVAMAYVFERLFNGARKQELAGVWIVALVVLVWVILSSSRTGFVMLCALFAMHFVSRTSRLTITGVLGLLASGCLVYFAYMFLFVSQVDLVLSRSDGFGDLERMALIEYGLRSLGGDPAKLLFGTGWDSSGIHNFVIQSLVDSGVPAAVFFAALVGLPILFVSRHPACHRESALVRGIALTCFIQLSLNAMPTLRALWIGLALAYGGMLWSAAVERRRFRNSP